MILDPDYSQRTAQTLKNTIPSRHSGLSKNKREVKHVEV